MITRCAHYLLFLLPLFAHAQDRLLPWSDHAYFGPAVFENPQDSVDFMQFRNGLQQVDPAWPADTTTLQYRLAWIENERGGMTVVSRGDGSVLHSPEHVAFIHYAFMSLPFRTADGRRVLILTHEQPCALICRTGQYYVEE